MENETWHSCNLISEEKVTSKKFTYWCNYILLTTGYFIPRFYYPQLSNQCFPIYPHFLPLHREAAAPMPNLSSHMLFLNIKKRLQCHHIFFLIHNIRSLVLVTATAHLLRELELKVVSEYGWGQGAAIESLPDSVRDVFGQVCFGLKCKNGSIHFPHRNFFRQLSNRKHMLL